MDRTKLLPVIIISVDPSKFSTRIWFCIKDNITNVTSSLWRRDANRVLSSNSLITLDQNTITFHRIIDCQLLIDNQRTIELRDDNIIFTTINLDASGDRELFGLIYIKSNSTSITSDVLTSYSGNWCISDQVLTSSTTSKLVNSICVTLVVQTIIEWCTSIYRYRLRQKSLNLLELSILSLWKSGRVVTRSKSKIFKSMTRCTNNRVSSKFNWFKLNFTHDRTNWVDLLLRSKESTEYVNCSVTSYRLTNSHDLIIDHEIVTNVPSHVRCISNS